MVDDGHRDHRRLLMTLNLPVSAEANELLTRNPMALLIGMLLDQQVPLEKAFSSPLELVTRLGHEPTAAELAEFDPDALTAVFSQRPALHRFPRAMAARTQDLPGSSSTTTTATQRPSGPKPGQARSSSTGWRSCPVSVTPRRRSSPRCSASSSGSARRAGARQPGTLGKTARTTPWPTSWTRTRWPRSAPTRRT